MNISKSALEKIEIEFKKSESHYSHIINELQEILQEIFSILRKNFRHSGETGTGIINFPFTIGEPLIIFLDDKDETRHLIFDFLQSHEFSIFFFHIFSREESFDEGYIGEILEQNNLDDFLPSIRESEFKKNYFRYKYLYNDTFLEKVLIKLSCIPPDLRDAYYKKLMQYTESKKNLFELLDLRYKIENTMQNLSRFIKK